MADRPDRRLIVYHRSYGCESGCCGHVIKIHHDEDDNGTFVFDHPAPGETDRAFAERVISEALGAEHVRDLDWDACEVSDA